MIQVFGRAKAEGKHEEQLVKQNLESLVVKHMLCPMSCGLCSFHSLAIISLNNLLREFLLCVLYTYVPFTYGSFQSQDNKEGEMNYGFLHCTSLHWNQHLPTRKVEVYERKSTAVWYEQ